jgi:hypothetical protein
MSGGSTGTMNTPGTPPAGTSVTDSAGTMRDSAVGPYGDTLKR